VNLDAVLAQVSRPQLYSIVESQAPINLWEGAVRSGKTIASIVRWFLFLQDPPPGGELVMIGKTRDTLYRNILQPMTQYSLFGEASRHVHYTPGAQIAWILGHKVHILGANDAKSEPKIRGLTIAGAYVDETTVLPQAFFDQLVARCSVPGARIFATTNPDSPSHWARKEYMLRPAEVGLRSWHFRLDDNPHLPIEYVARLKRTYRGLWRKRFIDGDWVAAAGACFESWDPARHVVPTLPPIARWLSCGIDYGTTNPFSAIMLGLGTDGILYATSEWRWDSHEKQQSLTDVQYSREVRAWLKKIPTGPTSKGVVPEYVIVDPSAASFRLQLDEDGLSTILGDNTVVDGVRTLASLFAAGALKVHVSCTGLINEIPGYVWEKTPSDGERPLKENDHSIDALRYATYTTIGEWLGSLAVDLDLTLAA
jgi:PBSX family phage terminase large subunit